MGMRNLAQYKTRVGRQVRNSGTDPNNWTISRALGCVNPQLWAHLTAHLSLENGQTSSSPGLTRGPHGNILFEPDATMDRSVRETDGSEVRTTYRR